MGSELKDSSTSYKLADEKSFKAPLCHHRGCRLRMNLSFNFHQKKSCDCRRGDTYPLNYIPARERIVSATLSALLKGKSLAVNSFPASPAVIFTAPTWQVVSAPIGNAAMRSAGVLIGNFASLSAPVICAWSWSFTDCVMVLTNTYWIGL